MMKSSLVIILAVLGIVSSGLGLFFVSRGRRVRRHQKNHDDTV